jgi:hypothetical protein
MDASARPRFGNQKILPYIQLHPTDSSASVRIVRSKEINAAIIQNLMNALRLRTLTDTLKQRNTPKKGNLPITNQVVQ